MRNGGCRFCHGEPVEPSHESRDPSAGVVREVCHRGPSASARVESRQARDGRVLTRLGIQSSPRNLRIADILGVFLECLAQHRCRAVHQESRMPFAHVGKAGAEDVLASLDDVEPRVREPPLGCNTRDSRLLPIRCSHFLVENEDPDRQVAAGRKGGNPDVRLEVFIMAVKTHVRMQHTVEKHGILQLFDERLHGGR